VPEFAKLGLGPNLVKALSEAGYKTPTPIQMQAIPSIIAGHDLLGVAQTGTGKTAAFALPILEYLEKHKAKPVPGRTRVLVLTPTRELAAQIEASFRRYGKHLHLAYAVVYGGVGQDKQVLAVAAEAGLDLGGQLAGGGQHQHAGASGHRLGFVLLEVFEDGQGERGGLAGAGLGHAQQVMAGDDRRDGLHLDGGGGLVAGLAQRFHEIGAEAELCEFGHVVPLHRGWGIYEGAIVGAGLPAGKANLEFRIMK
jgi:hypothetical protein